MSGCYIIIGYTMRLYRANGRENGSYYIRQVDKVCFTFSRLCGLGFRNECLWLGDMLHVFRVAFNVSEVGKRI